MRLVFTYNALHEEVRALTCQQVAHIHRHDIRNRDYCRCPLAKVRLFVCRVYKHPSPTHQGEGGRRQNSLLKITQLDEFSEKAYE